MAENWVEIRHVLESNFRRLFASDADFPIEIQIPTRRGSFVMSCQITASSFATYPDTRELFLDMAIFPIDDFEATRELKALGWESEANWISKHTVLERRPSTYAAKFLIDFLRALKLDPTHAAEIPFLKWTKD